MTYSSPAGAVGFSSVATHSRIASTAPAVALIPRRAARERSFRQRSSERRMVRVMSGAVGSSGSGVIGGLYAVVDTNDTNDTNETTSELQTRRTRRRFRGMISFNSIFETTDAGRTNQ